MMRFDSLREIEELQQRVGRMFGGDARSHTAHRTERAYGTFARTFNIPSRYDLSKIEATQQHGTLTLRVPRAEQAMRRSIPVKSGVSNAPQNG